MGYVFFFTAEGIRRAECSHSGDEVLQFAGGWLSWEPHQKHETSLTKRNHAGMDVWIDETAVTTSTAVNDGYTCNQVVMIASSGDRLTVVSPAL